MRSPGLSNPVRWSFRFGLIILVFALLTLPFYSVFSHSIRTEVNDRRLGRVEKASSNSTSLLRLPSPNRIVERFWLGNLNNAMVETIETFAADCTTPRTSFTLGETVCAKTDGVTETDRFVTWILNAAVVHGGAGVTDITQNPQTFSYTPTSVGLWKASIADPSDSSIIPAVFNVTAPPPIGTYAADCVTPKATFTLGDTVCAKTNGIVPGFNRRLAWVDPAGLVRTFTALTTDPQNDSFTLPNTETSVIDIFVVDNRGKWKVNVLSGKNSVIVTAPFNVQGTEARADLSVAKSLVGADPGAAEQVKFTVVVTNFGPNAAANVELTDDTPVNATFGSVVQTSGPTFSCTGTTSVTCSGASLGVGETAVFEFTYTAGASGSTITNVATAESDTTDLNEVDNTAIYGPVSIGAGTGTPPTCSLECPNNITVAATGPSGAVVTFPPADAFGSCGTVTASPASGSTFPIGTTTVSVSSSTGGGNCTFIVNVIDSPNPTISCPANQTVQAPSGQNEATVNVGTPTATGSGVIISSHRTDDRLVGDPYPVGTTLITWVATDQFDRQATCTQTIVVTSQDTPTITCPSNKTFTASSGCTYTATTAEIGTPTTTGPGVTVTSERSDGLALTDPFPAGQTFIEWTATNSVGTASCTQTITVNATDTQAPDLTVPPSITTTTSSCSVLLDDELGVATAEDNCTESVNISRTGVPRIPCPVPGDPGRTCESFVFPTGTTTITYTATDAAGNTATGTQTVTVTESPAINPTITAPADVELFTGPGATSCGVTVTNLDATLGTATANDNCPGVVVTRSGVPAGNVFPLGNTTVTYTATDKSGNTATDTQVVTVTDNTPPVVTAPAAVTLFTGPGATACSVTVANLDQTLGTGSATDNCPGVGAVTRIGVPAGNVFPLGATQITYSATDAHGNTGTAIQVVTVVDNTAPVISCPANIILEPTCPSGAIATWTAPVGTDNCPGAVTTRTAGPASGSVFPIGTTTVTYSVVDANGNGPVSCSFTVTVLTPQAVIQNLQASVSASSLTGTQKNGLLSKLSAALQGLNGGQTNVACNKMNEFNGSVQNLVDHGDLAPAQGAAWINSSNHVRNTIGCTSLPCS